MRISHPYGSKERLFEMMNKVNCLNEELLPREKKNEIIQQFIEFGCDYLGINPNELKIEISYDPTEAAKMASFGKNTPETGINRVVAANRNLADVLRTLAHELVHEKQKQDGRLYNGAGDDGTEIENEANALAAIMMRRFGKANPIIFE
jgi:CO/xanthine dehydrogenase Mo-binding subunit